MRIVQVESPKFDRIRTLADQVEISGIGLHTGKPVKLIMAPGRTGRGIEVCRPVAGHQLRRIPVRLENVLDTDHCITIGRDGVEVCTIEHVISALAGLGIGSCEIFVDGPEFPIVDGSALPFVRLIQEAKVVCTDEERRAWEVLAPAVVSQNGSFISAFPDKCRRISYTIDFAHPVVGKDSVSLEIDERTYAREVAAARTFGFLAEVEWLRSRGLALGGRLENAVVVGDCELLNPPLRMPDEFVRHKILDAVGDLSILGAPLIGHVCAYKASHRLHVSLARQLVGAGMVRNVPYADVAGDAVLPVRRHIVHDGAFAGRADAPEFSVAAQA
ncbi:MAG: UDP-3-O-[3-hydroxymyristoyl] N-acetylglucosamine deacetylase [Candidatus Schekmanbacteria bacterium]|nr:UDP-3-O-[3-hydroxymyristoyl] N-acetylglucosamine deacetylase [Candidatus Schekmanbacteria bacterium]